jgi:hypothetical protein
MTQPPTRRRPHFETDEPLLQALARLAGPDGTRDDQELRAAVAAFVHDAKSRLTPPQEVIAAVKAHLQRVPCASFATSDDLAARVVRWAIDDYYR